MEVTMNNLRKQLIALSLGAAIIASSGMCLGMNQTQEPGCLTRLWDRISFKKTTKKKTKKKKKKKVLLLATRGPILRLPLTLSDIKQTIRQFEDYMDDDCGVTEELGTLALRDKNMKQLQDVLHMLKRFGLVPSPWEQGLERFDKKRVQRLRDRCKFARFRRFRKILNTLLKKSVLEYGSFGATYLIEQGADIRVLPKDGESISSMIMPDCLQKEKPVVQLWRAACNGRVGELQGLVNKTVCPNVFIDDVGVELVAALISAARLGQEQAVRTLLTNPQTDILLRSVDGERCMGRGNYTALDWATNLCHFGIVRLLVEKAQQVLKQSEFNGYVSKALTKIPTPELLEWAFGDREKTEEALENLPKVQHFLESARSFKVVGS